MKVNPSTKLLEWLENQAATQSPGTRLPTVTELAGSFDISASTVKKVLRALQDQKLIIGIRGRGTYIASGEFDKTFTPAVSPTSVDTITSFIEECISDGTIKFGNALPSIKEMCLRFNVTAPTVIESYKRLQNKRLVTRIGKTFWAGRNNELIFNKTGKKDVYFFYYGHENPSHYFCRSFLFKSYRAMQRELAMHGYAIHYSRLTELPVHIARWKKHSALPYSILFCDMNRSTFACNEKHIQTLVTLNKTTGSQSSIVIIWHKGNFHPTPTSIHNFQCGHVSTSAARELAVYLRRKTPLRCAFFTSESDTVWGSFWDNIIFKIQIELQGLDRRIANRTIIIANKKGKRYSKQLQRRYTLKMQQKIEDNIPYNWRHKYGHTYLQSLEKELITVPDLNEAFNQAEQYNVWIFSTDKTASDALDWARENGIKIPQQKWIVGLKDDPMYYHESITTCAPDWQTNGYILAHAAIGDFPVKKTRKGFIASAGLVMERLTTQN